MATEKKLTVATEKKLTVVAEKRNSTGTSCSRRLRHAEKIPGVIYGNNKQIVHIQLLHKEVFKLAQNEQFYTQVINVTVDGEKEDCIVQEIQQHPFKQQILHIDLLRVSKSTKSSIFVPIHLINADQCIGVKEQQGIVKQLHHKVKIKCLASDIPAYVELDLANLKIGNSARLSNIKLPTNVSLPTVSRNDEVIIKIVANKKAVDTEEVSTKK